jgi:FdhD protein
VSQEESTDQASYQNHLVHTWEQGSDEMSSKQDFIIEECAIALVYNGISHAVMMATPTHLKQFAVGFSLSEGIVTKASQIYDITISTRENGIEVNLEISSEQMAALKLQRRNLVGRTGCGLCGSESLEQAIRPIKEVVPQVLPSAAAVQLAISQLNAHQKVQAITGAAHGAAWCDQTGNIEILYEDVGRHNALDKLIGALSLKQKVNHISSHVHNGFVLISSRASYEMVHKISSVNIPTLVAVSAPTSLAVTLATTAKINLIGFARPGRFVVYTNEKKGQL